MNYLVTIRGKVREGAKRGRQLNFPTANINLHKTISEGIYISQVFFEGGTYNAAAFIGAAKTFGETERKLEVYILDFNKNIYGKRLSVKLIQKIRDNKKFSSSEELVKQIQEDVKKTRNYFRDK